MLIWFMVACNGSKPGELNQDNLLGESDRPLWNPDAQAISQSSSSTNVTWTPPDEEDTEVQQYEVRALSEYGDSYTVFVPREEQEHIFEDLRSDTEFTFTVSGCTNDTGDYCDYFQDMADDASTNITTSTQVERWVFSQIYGSDGWEYFIPQGSSPSIIDLSIVPNEASVLRFSYLQDNEIYFSTLEIDTSSEISITATSDPENVVGGVNGQFDFTSARILPTFANNMWRMGIYGTADMEWNSFVGQWLTADGASGFDFTSDLANVLCSILDDAPVCHANTCLDNDMGSPEAPMASMSCLSMVTDTDLIENGVHTMLLQGQHVEANESVSPTNLYLVQKEQGNNGWEWSFNVDANGYAEPLLIDAAAGNPYNYATGLQRLYFTDTTTNQPQMLYWDASLTGDPQMYDETDLEDRSRACSVELLDGDMNVISFAGNRHLMEQSFITIQDVSITFATIQNGDESGIAIGYLSNP